MLLICIYMFAYIEQKGIKERHLGNNMMKLRMKKPRRGWRETHFALFFSFLWIICLLYALNDSHTNVMVVFTRLLTVYIYIDPHAYFYIYVCTYVK